MCILIFNYNNLFFPRLPFLLYKRLSLLLLLLLLLFYSLIEVLKVEVVRLLF